MRVIKEFEKLFGPIESRELPSFYVKQILRRAWAGSMSSDALRGLCWRVFLGIISPSDKSLWRAQLTKQVSDYELLKLNVLPSIDKVKADPLSAALVTSGDESKTDEWNSYYRNVELITFIKGDLDRLFLNGIEDEFFQNDTRRNMLQNILNVWSVQHPNISYRQGMHEIAGIVLFAVEMEKLGLDSSKLSHEAYSGHMLHKLFTAETIESHSFYIFERIMAELHPLYDPLPTSTHGLENQPFVVQFSTKIQEHYLRLLDPELCEHLESSYVQSQLYGLRWARLLLAREFPVDDQHVLRLWDYMFACCYDSECENPSSPTPTQQSATDIGTAGTDTSTATTESASPLPLDGNNTNSSSSGSKKISSPHPLHDDDMPPNIYSVLANARIAEHTCMQNINNPILQKYMAPQAGNAKNNKTRGAQYVVTPLLGVLGDFMLAMMLQIRDTLMEADSNIVIGYLMRYPEITDIQPIIENADMIRRGVLIREARLGASFLDAGMQDPLGAGAGPAVGSHTPSKGKIPQWLIHPTGGRVSGALLDAKDKMGAKINKMMNKDKNGEPGEGFLPRTTTAAASATMSKSTAAATAAPTTRRRVNSQVDYEDDEEEGGNGSGAAAPGIATGTGTDGGKQNVVSPLDFDPLGVALSTDVSSIVPVSSALNGSTSTASTGAFPSHSTVTPNKAGFGKDYGRSSSNIKSMGLLDEMTSSNKGSDTSSGPSSSGSSSSSLFGVGSKSAGGGGGSTSSSWFLGSSAAEREQERKRGIRKESEDGLPLELLDGAKVTAPRRHIAANSSSSAAATVVSDARVEGVNERMSAIADVLEALERQCRQAQSSGSGSSSRSSSGRSSGSGDGCSAEVIVYDQLSARLRALCAVLDTAVAGHSGRGYSLQDYDAKFGSAAALHSAHDQEQQRQQQLQQQQSKLQQQQQQHEELPPPPAVVTVTSTVEVDIIEEAIESTRIIGAIGSESIAEAAIEEEKQVNASSKPTDDSAAIVLPSSVDEDMEENEKGKDASAASSGDNMNTNAWEGRETAAAAPAAPAAPAAADAQIDKENSVVGTGEDISPSVVSLVSEDDGVSNVASSGEVVGW